MYDKGIEAFLAISSCHSISGAARQLFITQSAISHRLSEFESRLGIILIDRIRGSRHCKLTRAGEIFLPTAELWNQAWCETEKLISNVNVLFLKIGCTDSVNTYILPKLYEMLIKHVPPVHLSICTLSSIELYNKIERRDLDVAFVLQERHRQQVIVAPFYQEPMKIVRMRQRKTPKKTVRAEDLDPTHELYINWNPPHQFWHDRVWDPAKKAVIELDTVNLIDILIQDPKHWALVPTSALNHLSNKKNLIVQDIVPMPPDRITYMIKHRFPRIAIREGIEILESLARELGFLGSRK